MPDPQERKLATILFADIVGSTADADAEDPERTRAALERFYEAMSSVIGGAGGTVEKFAGDAVMAAFGAPEALEDHAERALHAALAMLREHEALRIGVNTGEVVVGRAREGSSFVSGDAVNVAARLQQAAEPGEILAGRRTVAAAGAAFTFGDPRTVQAKGKPDGVQCRPVMRALALARPRGDSSTFVGRADELERLWRAYRRSVGRSSPVLVTVIGDAGVGKSRLMRELWMRLAGEDPEPLRRTGRCLPYGEGITFWPLAEALKEHFGILESDPPEEVRRRLGDREILGLTLGLDVAGDLHPLAARDKLHAAWIDFVTEQATTARLVLLVEDVHWAESPLLELLERLVRDVRAPLLVLATARPEFARPWDVRIDVETILLEPLAPDVAALLVDERLPLEVREEIVRRAEGNPFFVEELVQLARENGREIPDSVQAVLASRIDLLGDAEKAALQAAAVIGRVFWTGPMYELVGEHAPDVATLEIRDFIRRRPRSSLAGEVEYVFKHALTRDVAYNGLTKARRARLHAEFARWLERTGGGRDEHASLLAHHYAEAVRPEDVDVAWPQGGDELDALRATAVDWLERAADLSIGRYEIDDGVALLDRALQLESGELRQSELWRKVGLANALKFDGEAFWTAMQRSLAVWRDRERSAETYGDLAFQTAIRSGMWPRRPQPELVQGWIDDALALATPSSAARAKALLADCFWNRTGGREAAEEANAIAERLGDVELLEFSFAARAWLALERRQFSEAVTWSERSLALVDEIDDPDHLADLYENAIPALCGVGRFDEARGLVERHRAVADGLTPHRRLHAIAVQLEIDEICGTWGDVLSVSDRIAALVEQNLSTPCIRNARSLLVLALAAAEAGEVERAAAVEEQALEIALEGYESVLASVRARLALLRGDVAAALRFVHGIGDSRMHWTLPNAAVRLDVLVAAGAAEELEGEVPAYARPGTYTEPFALRALGIVRNDDVLLERADNRFRALGLDWYADQTERLRMFRSLAAG